jgi:transcriptional regulator with XRE-family HTH domain
MLPTMPRKSKLSLPLLELGEESVGRRIARIRKERGYTQNELAERIGTIQALVSDYERDKLRLNAEMAVRFAIALEVTTDELLGLHSATGNGKKQTNIGRKASRKVLRRLEKIESLPTSQQAVLLKTIDTFIKAAGK